MDYVKARVTKLLVDFFETDFRRIEHALHVLKQAEGIMAETETPPHDPELVIAVALLHDVGIKPSEEILGHNNGKTQEEYGPPIAKELLESIGFPPEKTTRACQIIGNHHSRSRYAYPELEILKKADLIVNRAEGGRH